MNSTNRIKDQIQTERSSASSISKLVSDNYNNKLTDEQPFNQRPMSIKNMQNSANKPTFGGPHNVTRAATIIWYICICTLFIIAFLALIVSILYFLNDSSTEQVIKLYGITGSGCLAVITFVIIFLDCCNDGDREDDEEEVIYRILQMKDNKDKELARRRKRRLAKKREEKSKLLVTQQVHNSAPTPTCHHHHHHYPQPHHVHHIHTHPHSSYHHPYVCSRCHDSHASNSYLHSHADVGVDTSDRLETISKLKKIMHQSTHDVQTEQKLWDAEHRIQTDRPKDTQTSTVDLNDISNVSEIINETKA